MPIKPGHIILLGSGETSPSIRTVYHWLFTELNEPIHTAILETPAGFEPNSRHVAEQIEQFIAKRLQNFKPQISIVPARKKGTAYSPDDPAIASQLHPVNVILTGPGSPSYAARQLMDSVTWQTLQACHRAGASLIFASASTSHSMMSSMPGLFAAGDVRAYSTKQAAAAVGEGAAAAVMMSQYLMKTA